MELVASSSLEIQAQGLAASVVEEVKAKQEGEGEEDFEEEEEIQLVTDKQAESLRKECATKRFIRSGEMIPQGLLEKKNKQLAKWKTAPGLAEGQKVQFNQQFLNHKWQFYIHT